MRPTTDNLKHKIKVADDIENFFQYSVSQFMICVNELSTQNATRVLEPLAIMISYMHLILREGASYEGRCIVVPFQF
jgi:leucyl-tRNA synthetase